MSSVPRVRDVAERARVSVSLVSSYLNTPELVSVASRSRIEQAIQELGFVPNAAARLLRQGVSGMIAFVAYDISDPLFISVARGARRRATQSGLSLVLADTDGENETERDYLTLFEKQRVRGVLLSPAADPVDYVDDLRMRHVPAVLVDRVSTTGRHASVSINDVLGGRLAVGHLLSTGKRSIAVVGGPDQIRQVHDRREGAREAVATVPGARLEIIDTVERNAAGGRGAAEQLLMRQAEDRPDGIFCINDGIAVGLLQAFLQDGRIRIPEDLGIIGYNDTSAELAAPMPISSIRQPHEEFGSTAVDLLLLNENEAQNDTSRPQIVFDPELVVRGSSRRA